MLEAPINKPQPLDVKAALAFDYLFPQQENQEDQALLELVEEWEQEQELTVKTKRG